MNSEDSALQGDRFHLVHGDPLSPIGGRAGIAFFFFTYFGSDLSNRMPSVSGTRIMPSAYGGVRFWIAYAIRDGKIVRRRERFLSMIPPGKVQVWESPGFFPGDSRDRPFPDDENGFLAMAGS